MSILQEQLEYPTLVPDFVGRTKIVVMNDGDQVPSSAVAFMGQAGRHIGLRFAGGCSGMTDETKLRMLEYFPAGLTGFVGAVASGGNRGVDEDGNIDIMVTDVPAALVAADPANILGVSTLPRTGTLGITGPQSTFTLDDSNRYGINPGVHMVILVQDRSGFDLDWDGDLDAYFQLYKMMSDMGGWRFGMFCFNGGGITVVEALRAALLGWPVFLVTGSGRATDQMAEQVQKGVIDVPQRLLDRGVTPDNIDLSLFELVSFDDPDELYMAAVRRNLIFP